MSKFKASLESFAKKTSFLGIEGLGLISLILVLSSYLYITTFHFPIIAVFEPSLDGFSFNFHMMTETGVIRDFYPMYFSHIFRYFAVYPFYYLQDTAFVFINALLVLFSLIPVWNLYKYHFEALSNPETYQGRACSMIMVLGAPLLFLSIMVSVRSYMVMLSMIYLYIIVMQTTHSAPFHVREFLSKHVLQVLYIVSALFANMSSGALLLWMVLFVLYYRSISAVISPVIKWLILLVVLVIMMTSMLHKAMLFSEVYLDIQMSLPFMPELTNIYQKNIVPARMFEAEGTTPIICPEHQVNKPYISEFLDRGKMMELYTKCHFEKFYIYVLYLAGLIFCIVTSRVQNAKELFFFLSTIPFVFLEGVGFSSMTMVVYSYIIFLLRSVTRFEKVTVFDRKA